jgi:hypothetical protein
LRPDCNRQLPQSRTEAVRRSYCLLERKDQPQAICRNIRGLPPYRRRDHAGAPRPVRPEGVTYLKPGLKLVEGFPCLYTSRWLILFVYVDDIVIAFHRLNANLYRSFEKDLVDLYNIKAMGDLTWFLGIRIVRDRALHKT